MCSSPKQEEMVYQKEKANGAGGSSQVNLTLSQVLPLQSVRDIIVKA